MLQNKDWGSKLISSSHFVTMLVESHIFLVGLHLVISKKKPCKLTI